MQLFGLLLSQCYRQLALYTFRSNQRQRTDAHIVYTVLTVHHRRYGRYRIAGSKQQRAQLAYRSGYCIECRTLSLDDLSACLVYILGHCLTVERLEVHRPLHDLCIALHRCSGNISQRPRDKCAVSMLTKYISMNIFLCNFIMLGQSITQSCSIQNGTGTDDVALRNTGNLRKYIGHDVDRIAYDHIFCVRRYSYNLRSNVFKNIYVGLGQLDSRLARSACDTGSNDDDVRILCILIIARHDGYRITEEGSLCDIHNLAEYLFLIDVNQYDFRSSAVLHRQCICNSRSYASCSNDSNFSAHAVLLELGGGLLTLSSQNRPAPG